MKKRLLVIIIAAAVLLAAAVSIALLLRPSEKPLTAAELLDLGEKYLHERDYEQALVHFLKVIEIEPMNVRGYLGGTDAYLHLDRIQEAVDWLKNGIDASESPTLPLVLAGVEKSVIEGYIALAEAYEAEGWHDKAMELLQRVYDETGDEIIGRKLGIVEASEIAFRDDYVIEWKDPGFESLIRQYLGKESGDIHYDDVKLIERIDIWGQIIAMQGEELQCSYSRDWFRTYDGREGANDGAIKSLADLEHFSSLMSLSVNYQSDLDISELSNVEKIDCLHRLAGLTLNGNNISDISAVSNLIALKTLSVMYNNIADISPISMLIELQNVFLGSNEDIVSAEPLKGLRKLSTIVIDSADLRILLPLTELNNLHIFGASDWSVLPELKGVTYLEISATDANFNYITRMTALENLRLHGGGIRGGVDAEYVSLKSIAGIEALRNLKRLDILAYDCHDISPISSLGVEVLELQLPDDCDLTPLAKMPNLNKVIVSDIYGGPFDDVIPLIDRVRAVVPGVEVTSDRY